VKDWNKQTDFENVLVLWGDTYAYTRASSFVNEADCETVQEVWYPRYRTDRAEDENKQTDFENVLVL
jgi:hypothetical protein